MARQIIENVTTGNFYFQDSLGNTSHVTDAVGNLLERYTYTAFGTPTFYNAAGGIIYNAAGISQSALGIKHLFQGQLWTQETGLNDYRNRVELPTMGIFLQPDPIGFKGDAANIYRFCGNDPVDRTDPLGLIDSNGGGSYSTLTSFGGGDWIKGSDGLSASDWNHKHDQAGMDGGAGASGAGSGGNDRGGKSMGWESEGKKSETHLDNALKPYDIPGAIRGLENAITQYSDRFPKYPDGAPVVAALRAALEEGRIKPGLPSNFIHNNPLTTINRVILIDTRARISMSRLGAHLAHEGEHLADKDFGSPFMRERRAFDVQHGFGTVLGLSDRRKTNDDIHKEYGF